MNTNYNRLSIGTYIASLAVISLSVFFGLILITKLLKDGMVPLASAVGAVILFFSLVYLRRKFSPYRWLAAGIVFIALFTIYPVISTFLISTTNMSGGHLITKRQAIERLETKTYLPAGAPTYHWTAYRRGDNSFLVLFENERGDFFIGIPGKPIETADRPLSVYGQTAGDGKPIQIDGHSRCTPAETITLIEKLGTMSFSRDGNPIRIQSIREATETAKKYSYRQDTDSVLDLETGIVYTAERGTFISKTGDKLVPGFKTSIGADNYARFIGNPGYRKPISRIILWNILFSLLSVLISFLVGLVIAIVFDDLPGKRIIRTLLIIPYPIPVLVSITVWRGLLNESMGLITNLLQTIFGSSPHFFTDRTWARIALILINVYLSYPYFYILSSGALRSISEGILEAAEIDGANSFMKLRLITLPLVLRILMPLLIASFSFNFNNFTLIWGYNTGLPAMADTIVPMGYTDLLISLVYRLGFSTANASDYGFAAAITVLLFLFVMALVIIQIKSTRALKED